MTGWLLSRVIIRPDAGGLVESCETDTGRDSVLSASHEPFRDSVALGLADVTRKDRHPSHLTSWIHAAAMYCGPQSHRTSKPRAISLANPPNMPDALAERLQRGPAITEFRHMAADDSVDVMIDRAEEPHHPSCSV